MENQNLPPLPTISNENKNLILAVAAVAIVAFFLGLRWFYLRPEAQPDVYLSPAPVDEDTALQEEIDSVDVGDLDAQFEAIDSDMNSL